MLWVDKHRPTRLEKLDFHSEITNRLSQLATAIDLPHLCVYGPSGAGKKTRIMALLREIYGPSVEKLSIQQRNFETPGGTKLQLHTVSSSVHVEMTPSDVGNHDRLVVQELIKEMAQTQQVDPNAARKFKIVVINEADQLSLDAQHGLRRTMEKYMGNLRIILCANSIGRIIDPIRSRCLLIRVGAPTVDEVVGVLQKVGSKEHIHVPDRVAEDMANKSNRNLRQALLMLEAAVVQVGTLKDGMQIPVSDWEVFLAEISGIMVQEQSPASLLRVRGKFYELLSHCIPAELIMQKLTLDLLPKVDDKLRLAVLEQAAFYEHRIRKGNKSIYHLEAFAAKFMHLYKRNAVGLVV